MRCWDGWDAWDVATRIARECDPNTVMLLNGAYRYLLGNHWFGHGAMHAIDENLHRRSVELATSSYFLNDYGNVVQPDNLHLSDQARRLCGKDKTKKF